MSQVDSCSQSLSRRASSSETVITGIPRLCVPLKPWSAPGRIALGFLEIIADGRIAIAHRSPRDGRNRMGTDALATARPGGDTAAMARAVRRIGPVRRTTKRGLRGRMFQLT